MDRSDKSFNQNAALTFLAVRLGFAALLSHLLLNGGGAALLKASAREKIVNVDTVEAPVPLVSKVSTLLFFRGQCSGEQSPLALSPSPWVVPSYCVPPLRTGSSTSSTSSP